MVIGGYIKKNYPQTNSMWPILLLAVALLAISQIRIFSNGLNDQIANIFQWSGMLIIVVVVVVAVLETFAKFIPLASLFLNWLVFVLRLILSIYTFLIKFLIKSAVIAVLEEKGNVTSESFILSSEDGSDQFGDRAIKINSIKSLEVVVKPSDNSSHWRIGFKFSEGEVFSNARFDKNYPLLHLTKDKGVDELKIDYYDEYAIRHSKVIQRGYKNGKFTVKCSAKKELLKLQVYDENMKNIYMKDFSLKAHRYMLASSWGDGNSYEFDVKQYTAH